VDASMSAESPSIKSTQFFSNRSLAERLGLVPSIDNWLMVDRLSYPAEPLNAERNRKPNEDHVDNKPQN
jgi:hypothetical protein